MKKAENWSEIYHRLSKADQQMDLGPGDLQMLGLAAYLTGHDVKSFQMMERAHMGYVSLGQTPLAVRCAFWLGLMLMNAGEKARSNGWMARGERLLSNATVATPEKGLLIIPAALGAMSGGKLNKAKSLFEEANALGEKFDDADVMVLGRLGMGQTLVRLGEVSEGVKILDETMVSLETEDIYPVVTGIVYCAVIETCRKIWDLGRAKEWTKALSRWCDAYPEIIPFRGQCLVRRAEILQFHGDWDHALEGTDRACALLTRPPGEPAAAEAFYRRAELSRLLGNFEDAEGYYQEASRLGRNPQPGLALLRMTQGKLGAAVTSIRNTIKETTDPNSLSELLPGAIKVMIAGNHLSEAGDAEHRLNEIAAAFDSPYLTAMDAHSKGSLFFAKGNFQFALEQLQKASKIWNWLRLPYEGAMTRELKGLVYGKLDDKDNSETELLAAQWNFEQLKAVPDFKRVSQLLDKKKKYRTHGLTLREVQVLQVLAAGKSNKFIASELFISERTVDRHVSNIYHKIHVSSRVEAASFALKENLLD